MSIDTLQAGTPLFKRPTVVTPDGNLHTAAVRPAQGGALHTEFVGVTLLDEIEVDTERGRDGVQIQRTGIALARVSGPVSAGQPVGRQLGTPSGINPHLSASGDIMVGVARQDVKLGETKLIKVELTPAIESNLSQAIVVGVYDNVLLAVPLGGVAGEFKFTDTGLPGIFVAKPRTMRAKYWKPGYETGNPGANLLSETVVRTPEDSASQWEARMKWALRYAGGGMRWRISANTTRPGAQGQQAIVANNLFQNFVYDDNGDHVRFGDLVPAQASYDYLESLEVIDPPYDPMFTKYLHGAVDPTYVLWIDIIKFPFAIETTPTDQAWVDAGMDGKAVYWQDLNCDSRRFVSSGQIQSTSYGGFGGNTIIPVGSADPTAHSANLPDENNLFPNDPDAPNPSDSTDLGIEDLT